MESGFCGKPDAKALFTSLFSRLAERGDTGEGRVLGDGDALAGRATTSLLQHAALGRGGRGVAGRLLHGPNRTAGAYPSTAALDHQIDEKKTEEKCTQALHGRSFAPSAESTQ